MNLLLVIILLVTFVSSLEVPIDANSVIGAAEESEIETVACSDDQNVEIGAIHAG